MSELPLCDTVSLNNKFRTHLAPSKMEFPLEGVKGTKRDWQEALVMKGCWIKSPWFLTRVEVHVLRQSQTRQTGARTPCGTENLAVKVKVPPDGGE